MCKIKQIIRLYEIHAIFSWLKSHVMSKQFYSLLPN